MEAYKNHRAGSALGAVHKVFDEKGKDAAKKKGESLGLEPHTVRSAISQWERNIFSRGTTGKKRTGKAKKSAKRVVRKTTKSSARPVKRVQRATKKADATPATTRVQRASKKASAAA